MNKILKKKKHCKDTLVTYLQNHYIKQSHIGTCTGTKTLIFLKILFLLFIHDQNSKYFLCSLVCTRLTNKKNSGQSTWSQYRYFGAGRKEVLAELELIVNLLENASQKNNLFNLPPTFIGYLSLLKKCQIIWVITVSESRVMSFPGSSCNLLLTSICHLTCIWSISQFIK